MRRILCLAKGRQFQMSLIPNMRKSIADKRNFEVFVKDKAWTNSGFDGNRISYESVARDKAICQP